jgi:hypothetical protein
VIFTELARGIALALSAVARVHICRYRDRPPADRPHLRGRFLEAFRMPAHQHEIRPPMGNCFGDVEADSHTRPSHNAAISGQVEQVSGDVGDGCFHGMRVDLPDGCGELSCGADVGMSFGPSLQEERRFGSKCDFLMQKFIMERGIRNARGPL